jgi:hypothetical protein
MNVAHSHDLSFSSYCSIDMALFCGLMVRETMPEVQAMHRQSCALKVVPILKSFCMFYAVFKRHIFLYC